jgi:hypothetical protein
MKRSRFVSSLFAFAMERVGSAFARGAKGADVEGQRAAGEFVVEAGVGTPT